MVALAATPAASRWCSSARPSSVSHAPSMQKTQRCFEGGRTPSRRRAKSARKSGAHGGAAAWIPAGGLAAACGTAIRAQGGRVQLVHMAAASSCRDPAHTRRCNSHALTTTAAKHTHNAAVLLDSQSACGTSGGVWLSSHARAPQPRRQRQRQRAPRGERARLPGDGAELCVRRGAGRVSRSPAARASPPRADWTHPPCRPRTSASSAPPGTWAPATARRPRRSPRRPPRW